MQSGSLNSLVLIIVVINANIAMWVDGIMRAQSCLCTADTGVEKRCSTKETSKFCCDVNSISLLIAVDICKIAKAEMSSGNALGVQ
jgi:hypothetical protein